MSALLLTETGSPVSGHVCLYSLALGIALGIAGGTEKPHENCVGH